jgi:hypothetical protein
MTGMGASIETVRLCSANILRGKQSNHINDRRTVGHLQKQLALLSWTMKDLDSVPC